MVEAAILESPERVDELLAPLRELGPEIDTVHPQPTAELLQLHMDPPGPTPGFGDGMLLTELPPAAVRAFLAAVGPDVSTDLLSAEIRHIGAGLRPEAAVARAEATGSAMPGVTAGFDAGFLVYGVGIAIPGTEAGLAASLGRLLSRIEPWRAPVDYLNFAEHRSPPSASSATGSGGSARSSRPSTRPGSCGRITRSAERSAARGVARLRTFIGWRRATPSSRDRGRNV